MVKSHCVRVPPPRQRLGKRGELLGIVVLLLCVLGTLHLSQKRKSKAQSNKKKPLRNRQSHRMEDDGNEEKIDNEEVVVGDSNTTEAKHTRHRRGSSVYTTCCVSGVADGQETSSLSL